MITKFGEGVCIVFGSILGAAGLFASSFAKSLIHIILCTGVFSGNGCTKFVKIFLNIFNTYITDAAK